MNPQGMMGQMAAEPPKEKLSSQDAYNSILDAASELIYGRDGSMKLKPQQAILRRMKEAEDPAKVVADTASLIITEIDKKQNDRIPDEAILPAAHDILMMLMEVGELTGSMDNDKNALKRAMAYLMNNLATVYGMDDQQINSVLDKVGGAGKMEGVFTSAMQGGGAPAAPEAPAGMAPGGAPPGPMPGMGAPMPGGMQGEGEI